MKMLVRRHPVLAPRYRYLIQIVRKILPVRYPCTSAPASIKRYRQNKRTQTSSPWQAYAVTPPSGSSLPATPLLGCISRWNSFFTLRNKSSRRTFLTPPRRRTGTASCHHRINKQQPRERRPHIIIVRSKATRRMNGRHLKKRFPESFLQSIIIIPVQGPGNYQCHRSDGNEIQPELPILKQLSATPLHTHEIQREVDTRQNHKDGNHIFYKRRIPVSHTGLLGRVPSGSRRRKSMTCGIKQTHATNQQQYNFRHSQHEIYRPQALRHDADFRMDLVVRHPRSLCREKHLIAHSEDR